MELQQLLSKAASGGAVLFCGAGFSADCLNLSENKELGAGSALLEILNDQLKSKIVSPYKDLRNAADKYIREFGEYSLLELLRGRFKVSHVTDEMVEILRFPWDRIYTTNYDDAIEAACLRAQKYFRPLNNLDSPASAPGRGLEIVHLHGYVEKWDILNFRQSCVLGATSYFETEKALGPWSSKLQDDFDRARIFVFVGFAAGDFHLNQVFFNAREARPKVFFVNRPAALVDPDLEMIQETFGRPMAIGRTGLAKMIRHAIASEQKNEPPAPSYERYERPSQAPALPTVDSIRDLFIFGKVDRTQIIRDISQGKSDYHILRSVTGKIIDGIENGKSATLITGEICDGKSLIVEELAARLATSRPVYLSKRLYESIVDETNSLISTHENPVFIIENCFDLSSNRLEGLLRLFNGTKATAILTTRSISARAEISDFEKINVLESLQHHKLSFLDDDEVEELVRLSDQIAGWTEFPRTQGEKLRFIRERCRRSLPAFLLELLRSEFVRNRYAEEFRKTIDTCSKREIPAIVAILYIAHVGHDAPASLLSNIFHTDVSKIGDRVGSGDHGLRLVHVENGRFKTVPSIGASRILREIVPTHSKNLIVDTVVEVLRSLSERSSGDDFERHLFTQLMRYSILSSVVSADDEINRFFDNVSKIDYCRTQILFWVQWHMAMVDQKRFGDADTYLKRSYTEAQAYERRTGRKYDLFQIDDRKAKFLMIRNRHEEFRIGMLKDLQEAGQITERLLNRNDLTPHPFDTLVEILLFFDHVKSKVPDSLRRTTVEMIKRVGIVAKKRASMVQEGYPTDRAAMALERLKAFEVEN